MATIQFRAAISNQIKTTTDPFRGNGDCIKKGSLSFFCCCRCCIFCNTPPEFVEAGGDAMNDVMPRFVKRSAEQEKADNIDSVAYYCIP